MPIQFLIRKNMEKSLYRQALINLINMDGNVLVLSTGYINNSKDWRNDKSIDDFSKWINEKNSELKIIIIGGKKDDAHMYPHNFKIFCDKLYEKIVDKTKFEIIFYRVVNDNWHGKVAVKILDKGGNKKFYATLIGSSNLTPINILDDQFGWNNETDLYIVDGTLVKDTKVSKVKAYDNNNITNCITRICTLVAMINETKYSLKEHIDVHLIYEEKNNDIFNNRLNDLVNTCINRLDNDNVVNKDELIIILKLIIDIKKLIKIRSEIEKSMDSLVIPGRDLTAKTKEIEYLNSELFKYGHDILDSTLKLYDDRNNCSFDDFQNIYNKIKAYEKHINAIDSEDNSSAVNEFVKSLQVFKVAVITVRKNLLIFRTTYDLKTDKTYIESIIKNVYIEINDIIENFSVEEFHK